MKIYTPKQFVIPQLEGISKKQIDEHLKLYAGYVAHTNKILELVTTWEGEKEKERSYEAHELWRRFGFEFGGMRNHEYYFGALENDAVPFDKNSTVGKAIATQFDSYEKYIENVKRVGTTRGSGWAMTYYDSVAKHFLISWVDEHHLGQLSTLRPILALDCWEHAYMVDYLPGERGTYIDSYLQNINWEIINIWFEEITS